MRKALERARSMACDDKADAAGRVRLTKPDSPSKRMTSTDTLSAEFCASAVSQMRLAAFAALRVECAMATTSSSDNTSLFAAIEH